MQVSSPYDNLRRQKASHTHKFGEYTRKEWYEYVYALVVQRAITKKHTNKCEHYLNIVRNKVYK